MRVRDYKKEYRLSKQLEMERKAKAGKVATGHFQAASDALWAVMTGYRRNDDEWSYDIERVYKCLRMAFKKDDEVFELSRALIEKCGMEDG